MALRVDIEAQFSNLNEIKNRIREIQDTLQGATKYPIRESFDELQKELATLLKEVKVKEEQIHTGLGKIASPDIFTAAVESSSKVLEQYAERTRRIMEKMEVEIDNFNRLSEVKRQKTRNGEDLKDIKKELQASQENLLDYKDQITQIEEEMKRFSGVSQETFSKVGQRLAAMGGMDALKTLDERLKAAEGNVRKYEQALDELSSSGVQDPGQRVFLQTQLDAAKTEAEGLKTVLLGAKQQLMSMGGGDELVSGIRQAQIRAKDVSNVMGDWAQRVAPVSNRLNDLAERAKSVQSTIAAARNEREALADENSTATTDRRIEIAERIKELNAEEQQSREELRRVQTEYTEASNELRNLEQAKGEAAASGDGSAIKSLKKEYAEATETVRQLKKDIEAMREETGENSDKLQEKVRQLESAQAKVQRLQNEIDGAARRSSEGGKTNPLSWLTGGAKTADAFREAISSLPPTISQGITAVQNFGKAAMTFMATPIGAVIGLVTALGVAVKDALGNTREDAGEVFGKSVQKGEDGRWQVVDVEQNSAALDDLEQKQLKVNAATALWDGIVAEVEHKWHSVGDAVINFLADIQDKPGEAIKGMLEGLVSMSPVLQYIYTQVMKVVDAVTTIGTTIQNFVGDSIDSVKGRIEGFVDGVAEKGQAAIAFVDKFVEGTEWAATAWGKVKTTATEVGETISDGFSKIGDTVASVWDGIVDKAKEVAGVVTDAATDMANQVAKDAGLGGMDETVSSIEERTEKLKQAGEMEIKLENRKLMERRKLVQLQNELAEARNNAYEAQTQKERIAALDLAMQKQREISDMQKSYAKEERDIAFIRSSASDDSKEDLEKLAAAEEKLMQIDRQRLTAERMIVRQRASMRRQLTQQEENDLMTQQSLGLQQEKMRLSMMKDAHDKEMELIRLSEKEQMLSVTRQETQWRRANGGVLKQWQQDYVETQKKLVAEQTEYNLGQKEDEYQEKRLQEVSRLRNQIEQEQMSLQDDTLAKTLRNIEIEKEERIRALEEQKKAWLKVQKELTEEQKEYLRTQSQFADMSETKDRMKQILDRNLAHVRRLRQLDNLKEMDERDGGVSMDMYKRLVEEENNSYEKGLEESGYLERFKTDLEEAQHISETIVSGNLEALTALIDTIDAKMKEAAGEGQEDKEMKYREQINALKEEVEKRTSKTSPTTKSIKRWGEMKDAVGGTLDVVSELSEGLDENSQIVVSTARTIAESTISIIDTIVNLAQTTLKSTEEAAIAASTAISTAEKASAILAIISAAFQIFQAMDRLLGGADDRASYNEAVEKQREINMVTSAVYEYERAVRQAQLAEKNWFSTTTATSLQDNWKEATEAINAYKRKANEQQIEYADRQAGRTGARVLKTIFDPIGSVGQKLGENLGGKIGGKLGRAIIDGLAPGSIEAGVSAALVGGQEAIQTYATNTVKAIDNLRFITQERKHGTWFRKGNAEKTVDLRKWAEEKYGKALFDENEMIDIEMAENILENFGDKVTEDTKESLQTMIDEAKAYKEAIENIKNSISDMFSPLVDNMSNALWTWLETGTNVMDTFHQTASETFAAVAKDLMKTLTHKMLFSGFEQQIEEIGTKYAKNEISENQLMEMSMQAMNGALDGAEDKIKLLQEYEEKMVQQAKEMGYDLLETDKQEATYGGFETMSESTGTELSGRFTALYLVGQNIDKNLTTLTTETFQSILMTMTAHKNVADEIRNLIALSYIELQSINDYEAKAYRLMEVERTLLERIRQAADTLL